MITEQKMSPPEAVGSNTKSRAKTILRPLQIQKILVPTDCCENSIVALKYAISLAEHFQAGITLLHVIEPPVAYADMAYTGVPSRDQDALAATQIVARVRDLAKLTDWGEVKSRWIRDTSVEHGIPWEVIVETAKSRKCDLIVLATHGRTGLARAFLGSTAEKVIRHAPCPVIVLRGNR